MKTFFALVHKDADSAYGVTFPDLPGCFSAADDLADVLPNACEALELWFEDEPMVEPRALDAITTEVAEELAAGAFLLAVPLLTSAGRSVRVNLSLDKGILEAIDTAASMRKLTRSAFIVEAARNEIRGLH
ncbi:type II toxin-antitoxin system HicB family antitoxin [Novosphingobium sp. SG707]|uniref:type II toxin-antitoxin system HicB family antitoxin n=1 Tax=Novosphingobium sp. SG707 TaxID=2586996 RepID=UPI00144875EA|nr:type II toxin-antitoxin system HicB family antitoxin [Novosphingobium sp. SG707]NKJ02779.1 putative RNase H-like HicB family nuclease [Novosphingobium sp. SG707]NKJ02876.1 putative RNase H-like HicB family nuclease [Novosphingobium sp. SG707]